MFQSPNLTARKRLPDRRTHEIIAFEHDGFRYLASVGHFPDGKIGEVFLNADKLGTAIETQARDLAIVTSLYLQHNGSLQTLRGALTRNPDGSASGVLGRLLDLLAADDSSTP
jgi:hypothetical protein